MMNVIIPLQHPVLCASGHCMHMRIEEESVESKAKASFESSHVCLPVVANRCITDMTMGISTKNKALVSKIAFETYASASFVAGHNGAEAAEHLRERLGRAVLEHGEVLTEPARALREACRQVDAQLAQNQALHFRRRQAGSTAVLCLLVPGTLAVANVGDSRATVIDQCANPAPAHSTDTLSMRCTHATDGST